MPRSGMNLWQNDVRPADWGCVHAKVVSEKAEPAVG
jgi:hypothetical protein